MHERQRPDIQTGNYMGQKPARPGRRKIPKHLRTVPYGMQRRQHKDMERRQKTNIRPGGNRPYEPRGPIESIQGTDRIPGHRYRSRGKNQEKRPAQHNETNQTAGTTYPKFVRRGRHCCGLFRRIRINPDRSGTNRQNMLLQRT